MAMRTRTVAVEYGEAEAFVEMMRRIQLVKGLATGWNGEGTLAPTGRCIRAAERFAKDRQSMATRLVEAVLDDGRIAFDIAPGSSEMRQGAARVTIDRAGSPELDVPGQPPSQHPSVSDRRFRKSLDDAVSPRGGKFGNIRRHEVDGIVFHSPIEARRYTDLRQRERLGEISSLERQVPYRFDEQGRHCFTYLADFVYVVTATGETVVEDVKGMPTDIYRLKKKLIEARFGIGISEWPLSRKEIARRAAAAEKAAAIEAKRRAREEADERRAAKRAEQEAVRTERRRVREARAAEKAARTTGRAAPKSAAAVETPAGRHTGEP